ncbi:MAG: hypothetical protein IJ112_05285 [Oscillospiraceae bacterium]|nr:hypothetical protein [Oscillospiraceae bacterium]
MRTELLRCFKNPLYWITLSTGLSIRMLFACLDRLHRSGDFWVLTDLSWNKIGSATVCFLILAAIIRSFSIDQESGTIFIISSTPNGRGKLFAERLLAGVVAAAFGTGLATVANIIISLLVGQGIPQPEDWIYSSAVSGSIALLGAIGFYVVAACMCDILQNHPATMCICGIPFVISYFVNVSAVKQFDLFWFLRYGFFTEFLRGRTITSRPVFWTIWYSLLLLAVFLMAVKKRRERKRL